ncbi:E3 ubiquitin-protein ligase RSL1-like protein [Drosera capensis]
MIARIEWVMQGESGSSKMEDQPTFIEGSSGHLILEEEDEFRSCCGEDGGWKEKDEIVKAVDDINDESVVRIYFKGVSLDGIREDCSGKTGIGVVIEQSGKLPAVFVQKKLDFYVKDSVADYLALLDGLAEAVKIRAGKVVAFTDSSSLCNQLMHKRSSEDLLIDALRGRIFELATSFEAFSVTLVTDADVLRPLQLARVAIGIVASHIKEETSVEKCLICSQDWPSTMTITLRCSHQFCSQCLKSYVGGIVQSNQVPIRCPQLRCKYLISTLESKSFLPVVLYDSLERAMTDASASKEIIYCPYRNCSVMLDRLECFSTPASSSCDSDNLCSECPVCQRFLCIDCGVPWHTAMSCQEYQNFPFQNRNLDSQQFASEGRLRHCQQCTRTVEPAQGGCRISCWCGHEFCYICGAEYRTGEPTCRCQYGDEHSRDPRLPTILTAEQWPLEAFDSFSMIMDAFSDQERSQLALIQRFLAGGFSLGDHHPYQSTSPCTDSYTDPMKDLHQLPWLESFVSVIRDDYYDDYIQ